MPDKIDLSHQYWWYCLHSKIEFQFYCIKISSLFIKQFSFSISLQSGTMTFVLVYFCVKLLFKLLIYSSINLIENCRHDSSPSSSSSCEQNGTIITGSSSLWEKKWTVNERHTFAKHEVQKFVRIYWENIKR
jgi:hypothetical protein